MERIRPDHVAIYIRWSTDDQATGTTLEVQREGCELFVRSQGWVVRDDLVFIDDGFSGGNLDRPGMSRLRRLVRKGEVDCVVVLKLDRLSRNIVDAVDLVLREWDGHCYLRSVLEPIDTKSDLGRVIFNILATFADFERAQIRDRTQGGKLRRIKDGKQMHAEPAFGYMRHPEEKGVWVENPSESPVVQRMFHMAADGMSANQICRTLNREGLRTRAGKSWSIRSVLWVLHNRTYIGQVVYGQTSLKPADANAKAGTDTIVGAGTLAARSPRKRLVRVVHETPKVDGPTNAAPALIDRDLFDRVQERLEANRTQRRSTGSRAMSSPHLLVGLARCECGGALVHKVQGGKRNRARGVDYRHYFCFQSREGRCNANAGYIPAEAAEKLVEETFLQVFGVLEQRLERFAPRMQSATEDYRSVAAALREAEAELQRIDEQEKDIQRQIRANERKLDLDDIRWLRQGFEDGRKQAHERIQTLRERLSNLELTTKSLERTLEALDAVERWDTLEVWQKRQLIRMVLTDRITLVKPKRTNEIRIRAPWAF